MQQENIKYVLIWSGWLRLCHWTIAFGVLFLIVSAWGIRNDYSHYDFWRDWHIITGQVMIFALIGRGILSFASGTANWRNFVDIRSQLSAMLDTIKFYLSFARGRLPNWYAHNPLWKPVYLIMYLILAGSIISGLMFESDTLLLSFTPRGLHGSLATIITVLVAAHILTVFLHDWKGKGAFISAMLSGHRYFHYDSKDANASDDDGFTEVRIDINSFKKREK